MSIVYFADLDDSLFQTQRKCRPDAAVIAADDGSSRSYMHPEQVRLLACMRQGQVVPVTARTLAGYRRVHITAGCRFASVYFGGMILVDGQVDRDYEATVRAQLAPLDIAGFARYLGEATDGRFRAFDTDGYYATLRYHAREGHAEPLAEALDALDVPPGFEVYHHDYQLVFLPSCITKARGARHLLDRIRPTLAIGIGDRLSDLGFMALMDYCMFPAKSDIGRSLAQTSPGITPA